MPRFERRDRSAAIGARICIARVTAGLPRPGLARDLGLSPQMVERYERGFARLPAVMLVDLGVLLDVTPAFFVGLDDGDTIARTLLLQWPKERRLDRQLDRALATLSSFAVGATPGGRSRSPAEERPPA